MTLRDDLEKAIYAQKHYERTGVMPSWVKHGLTDFLRDHGPALLEALRDAERYRFIRDTDGPDRFWIAHGNLGQGISRWTGQHADFAIDVARKGAKG